MQTIRYSIRYFAVFAALAAWSATTASAADEANADKEKEQQLIALLQSDAPGADKAIACKQLAVFGSKDAVPALAPLLADERLASWARIALEAIPGAEAEKALREAMGSLKGRLLIGAINSIGVRRDAGAVEPLAGRLKDEDAAVASAAAVALGRIGNDAATKLLRQALAGGPAAVRSAVAEGCILCAERLLAEDKADEAAEIYDEVRKADVPRPRILEATRGAILARKLDGIPLLVEQLNSADKGMFQIGLSAARQLAGREVTDALAAEIVRATPQRAALLLRALADRGDTVTSPVVLQSAKSGPKEIRVAAIGVLQRLGDYSSVPTLLEIATENDAELAAAAKTALAELPGKEVDAEIAARLAKADVQLLPLLIELVGQRRIDATPALLKALDHADPKIRHAALTALGATVGLDHLSVLISRVAAPKDPGEAQVAQQALRTACVRMADREACAGQLAAAMSQAPLAAKVALLEVLGATGGAKALQTIGIAAKGGDEQLQDVGSRLLGEWMTVDAAPVLLDLAKTPDNKFNIRALRGHIRLARQFNMPDAQRAEMCQQALEASSREAEKKLVLEVLERYPSVDMLKLAVQAAEDPAVKDEATRVALAIAQKLGGKSVDAQKLLQQIGQTPVKLEIIKAEYGAGAKQRDVTEALRRQAGKSPLIALPSPKYNEAFGGDPAPGVVKQLKVQFRIDGKAGEATFPEDATILLPVPK